MKRSAMLSQSIIELLDSASSENNELARCHCGALMQSQTTTFFMRAVAGKWNCRFASDAISLPEHQLMTPSLHDVAPTQPRRVVRTSKGAI